MSVPEIYGLKEYWELAGLWLNDELSSDVNKQLRRAVKESSEKCTNLEYNFIYSCKLIDDLEFAVKKFSRDYVRFQNQEHFKRDGASGQELRSIRNTTLKLNRLFREDDISQKKYSWRTFRALIFTSRRRSLSGFFKGLKVMLADLLSVIDSTIEDERLTLIKKEKNRKRYRIKKKRIAG